MKSRTSLSLALVFLSTTAMLLQVSCTTSDEPNRVLNMRIDKDNDSLLSFDSLIVTVYSKDSSFSHEIFHGILRDPKQVSNMPLDPRVGSEYSISIIGYKGGKIGVNKSVIFFASGRYQSKDLPIQTGKPDTVIITPLIPEILVPSYTTIAEGETLRFHVSTNNKWSGPTTLTLKDAIPGASLDTTGQNPGEGYFTWRPDFEQGRTEPFAVTFVYASANKNIEKTTRIKVLNVNRPPKLVAIADQKVNENETLSFKIEAADPDHDSLDLAAGKLPDGAAFSSDTFTWKPIVGQSGNYSVKFSVFDGRDSDLVSVLITVGNVDAPPPLTVEITSPAHDTTINFTPITVLYSVNGTALQKEFPLIAGKNRIRIDTTVQSRAGFDTILIILDTVPPGNPIVAGASPVNTRMPTWTWTGDEVSGIFRYKLDDSDLRSGATETRNTSFTPDKLGELKEGKHLLYVQQRDSAGNWSLTGSASVTVDLTPPGIPKITLAQASPTNNRQPIWNLASGLDGIGFYRLKLDDSTWDVGAKSGKVTSFMPEAALPEGAHTLYAQERDSAGNWSSTGWKTVVLDLTGPAAPKIDSTPYSPLNSLRPTWTWRSGGDGMKRYRCKVDTSILDGAPEISDSSFTPNGNLTQGGHVLYVQERDSVGNWSATSARQIFVSLREFVGSQGFANGYQVKITVNSKGTPYIGFLDNGSIKVKKFEDNAWKDVGAPIPTPSHHFQLKLSPKDVPYIAYQDKSGLDDIVSVVKLVGYTWSELEGGMHMVIDTEQGFEIDVDGQDVMYLAFQDPANGLQVLKYIGYWVSVGDAALKNLALTHIGVTGSGTPYILATDYSIWQPNVWTLSANKWVPLPSIGRVVSPWNPFFQVSQNGNVFVSFYADNTLDYMAKIISYKNGEWETVFPGENMQQVPIATNASGTLYRFQQSVYKYSGTSWMSVGGAVDTYGGSQELAISPNGVAYLSINNDANGSISVLKFSFEP